MSGPRLPSIVRRRLRGLVCLCGLAGSVLGCGSLAGCSWLTGVRAGTPKAEPSFLERTSQATARATVRAIGGVMPEGMKSALGLKQKPPFETDEVLAQAEQSFDAGDKPEAARLYQQIRDNNPENLIALRRLASIQTELGEYAAAEAALNDVLVHDSEDAETLMRLADLALRREMPEEALEYAIRVLRREPSHAAARLMAAKLHLENDRPDRAAPLLRGICTGRRGTSGEVTEARRLLAGCQAEAEDWRSASRTLSSIDEPTPTDRYRLAVSLYREGDYPAARRIAEGVLEREGRHSGCEELLDRLPSEARPAGFERTADRPFGHSEPR